MIVEFMHMGLPLVSSSIFFPKVIIEKVESYWDNNRSWEGISERENKAKEEKEGHNRRERKESKEMNVVPKEMEKLRKGIECGGEKLGREEEW